MGIIFSKITILHWLVSYGELASSGMSEIQNLNEKSGFLSFIHENLWWTRTKSVLESLTSIMVFLETLFI